MHRLLFLRLLVAAASCVVGPGGALAQDAFPVNSPGACHRVSLDPQPEWVVSATWSPDGRELIIPDILAGALWRYDLDGKPLGMEIRPSRNGLGWTQPTHISTLANGYLLTDGHRLVWLDHNLRPVRAVDPDTFPMTPEGRIDGFWIWSAAGDVLYSVSDIATANGSWRSGFVSSSLDDPGRFRVVRELPLRDRQELDFYLMGNAHVAVLDGVGYFLAMTAPPRIFVAGSSPRWLQAFAADLGRPALPLDEGPRNYATRLALYERMTAPVALFAAADRLFLLVREPTGDEGTTWTLHRIDPEKDRVERSFTLPSRANHLVLAPGPLKWAIVEKGPVEAKGEQDVHHLVLIPTPRLVEQAGAPTGSGDPCS